MAKNPKAPAEPGTASGGDPAPATRSYVVVSPLWVGGKKHLPGARVDLTESEAASVAGVVEPVVDEDKADDKK